MEYCIFPIKSISISGKYTTAHKAWDINGEDQGKSDWYAPCTLKVLALFPYSTTNLYNTVLYGTCDSNGNSAQVMCEDGVARVLTIGCTHMDDDAFNAMYGYSGNPVANPKYRVGSIIPSGTICYKEGARGGSNMTGSHVHMDVAIGWQTKRVSIDGGLHLNNTMIDSTKTVIGNTFHQLSGFNTERSGGLNGYTFKTISSRTVGTAITGYGLYTLRAAINIRTAPNTSAAVLTTVPKGQELKIIRFISGFQSDQWQWAEVYFNGIRGFSRVETLNSYSVVLSSTSRFNPFTNQTITPKPLYLMMSTKGGVIRSAPGGAEKIKVPSGIKILVTSLPNSLGSDGYQWVMATYNGVSGYVQADTKNWHYFLQ